MLTGVHLSTFNADKQGKRKGINVMNGLLEDGFGLMVLGMGFVFLFLVVLIFATGYMSRLLNHYFPEALPTVKKNSPSLSTNRPAVDAQLTAVITAAVHQHRNK